MSGWRPEHAEQVRAAYDVLRDAADGRPAAEVLYGRWYAVRPPRAARRDPWSPPVGSQARAAHRAATVWEDVDREVVATGVAGVVVVGTPQGRRALCRGEYVTTRGRPGFPPAVGDRVRALTRRGAVVQEGWWRTWGAAWNPRRDPGPLVRVYLRPADGAVARLVRAVTTALADTGDWLLKVAADEDDLARPDSCVVYLAGPDRERTRDLVTSAVAGLTAGNPPPLTERVADGVGWAEDPGTGESFGEDRCAALAAAHERLGGRVVPPAEWLRAVALELQTQGVDPWSPHRAAARAGGTP